MDGLDGQQRGSERIGISLKTSSIFLDKEGDRERDVRAKSNA